MVGDKQGLVVGKFGDVSKDIQYSIKQVEPNVSSSISLSTPQYNLLVLELERRTCLLAGLPPTPLVPPLGGPKEQPMESLAFLAQNPNRLLKGPELKANTHLFGP